LEGLELLALVGMTDPPAAGVAETVERFSAAGIRTVMITGDKRRTAEAVARELGLLRGGGAIVDARELASLEPERLSEALGKVAAFSRVSPGDKLRIVEGFQGNGQVVGMLGDGVNDAPALEAADIGVAMGVRGTDVAKETADIVLADDRFSTVAAAVEEGRVIFDNIRKFILYLFSCNLSEVSVLFAGVLLGLPLPLLPLQILWLNLVTDVFPALALAMEPAEPGVMRRPPRRADEALLSRDFLLGIAAYAVLLTSVSLGVFFWALEVAGFPEERARTLAFMTLALSQLFHVFNARSPLPVLGGRRLFTNRWVWAAVALSLSLQLAVVYLPPLAALLEVQALSAEDWVVVLLASTLPLFVGQGVKAFRARS
ncbi:MAG: HAD-IC family P-type ATPase, partial [Holophagales bacterium]|nr:HAD-IC family P-type ATPase [Holophagales bacterium]